MEVGFGQGQVPGEGAGVFDDAEDGAAGAVAAKTAGTPVAAAAGEVDFAGDALAGVHSFADEFVAGASGEAIVAAQEFDVGVADAREADADQHMARLRARHGRGADLDCAGFDVQRGHCVSPRIDAA
jgi:hypothetical protein